MALYKDSKYVTGTQSRVADFDTRHSPGGTTPSSGIYKCTVCGKEIVSEEKKSFPPQNHHQHGLNAGPIAWKLIVLAEHNSTVT
ncbi:MAG: hypothetical protein ACLQVI_22085 [Polyangiaceae bacterium]